MFITVRTPDPIVKDLESLTVADGPESSQTVSSKLQFNEIFVILL